MSDVKTPLFILNGFGMSHKLGHTLYISLSAPFPEWIRKLPNPMQIAIFFRYKASNSMTPKQKQDVRKYKIFLSFPRSIMHSVCNGYGVILLNKIWREHDHSNVKCVLTSSQIGNESCLWHENDCLSPHLIFLSKLKIRIGFLSYIQKKTRK